MVHREHGRRPALDVASVKGLVGGGGRGEGGQCAMVDYCACSHPFFDVLRGYPLDYCMELERPHSHIRRIAGLQPPCRAALVTPTVSNGSPRPL